MSGYTINRFNSSPLVTVEDGTTNDDFTHIKFVGRNVAGYGEIQNENFLWLLENFASVDPPTKKLNGMIWYDSGNKKLKFFDGSNFRTTGGAEINSVKPSLATPAVAQTKGDFWYNTSTKQIFVYDPTYSANDGYILVGPLAVEGRGQTNFESVSVKDDINNDRTIVKAVVDGTVMFIISTASFTLNSTNTITGFSHINEGITIVNSTTGVTSSGSSTRFWGTASDSDRLGGELADAYLLKNSATFTAVARFPDAGVLIGDSEDLHIFVDTANSNRVTLHNQVSSSMYFKTTDSNNTLVPMILNNKTVIPGADLEYDLGSSSARWKDIRAGTVHATTFYGNFEGSMAGVAEKSDRLKIDNTADSTTIAQNAYRKATTAATIDSIAARDGSGNLTANVFNGVATQARYADLAERYAADSYYDPGTVLVFGGEQEVTTTVNVADTRIAGVVSTNPAYLMNSEAGDNSTHPAIALRGKIPVKVVGIVKKGDVLVSSYLPGYAEVAANQMNVSAAAIIGKSLEEKNDVGTGIIMVVV